MFKKLKYTSLFGLVFLLNAAVIFASQPTHIGLFDSSKVTSQPQKYSFDFSKLHSKFFIQLGGFIGSQGSGQHIDIEGTPIGDYFSVSPQNRGNGLVGVGYYLEGHDTPYVNLFYGINAFYLARTKVAGDVTQENLFTNLSYSYFITNWPIYLDAKAEVRNKYSDKFIPTLDIGIGTNIIVTSEFHEKSLNADTIPDNIFSGKTTTSFSATVGVGIKFKEFFGSAPLECGYRFFYLGQGKLKALTAATSTLNTGHSYANALMCAITV